MGRVARIEVTIGLDRGEGLLAVYKDGPAFEVVVIDAAGRARPDWAAALRDGPLDARAVADDPMEDGGRRDMVRRLGARLDPTRRPHALAVIAVRPAR